MNILLETDCKNNRYKLAQELIYKGVYVPYGFSSDGMTKGVNKYKPRQMRGSLIHDVICDLQKQAKKRKHQTKNITSYKKGRQYAREIWIEDGCSWWQVTRWYRALCLFDFVMRRK